MVLIAMKQTYDIQTWNVLLCHEVREVVVVRCVCVAEVIATVILISRDVLKLLTIAHCRREEFFEGKFSGIAVKWIKDWKLIGGLGLMHWRWLI